MEKVLLEVIAEKTGYPAEMLDLDMAMDADLGIDSISRWKFYRRCRSVCRKPQVKPEHLGTLHNLRDIAAFLAGSNSKQPLLFIPHRVHRLNRPRRPPIWTKRLRYSLK